jgi:hypothetical protein
MSATKFRMGKGSVFSISSDGTTFTPVKQQKTVNFSGSKSDLEDITNMDSPAATREWAPTLLDSGQCAIQGVFLDSDPGQLAVNAAYQAQTLLQCKLQMAPGVGQSTGFLRTFSAYVTEGGNLDAQFDKSTTFSATFKLTGAWTDTPGTTGS